LEVDFLEARRRGLRELLVFTVHDAGDIWGVVTSVAFSRKVEWPRRVIFKPLNKELQEGVNINRCIRGVRYGCSFVG
jgi:hypothetical protein